MTTPALKTQPAELFFPVPPEGRPATPWIRLRRRLKRWAALSRQRRALAGLDRRLLEDVGLNPSEAARESARWFFDESH